MSAPKDMENGTVQDDSAHTGPSVALRTDM